MTRISDMMMIEARRAERVRSLLRARILFNNQNSTFECTVKNISPLGAKIELANTLAVPEIFDLEIPQKGRTYRARLSWRDRTALGVEFLQDEPKGHEATQARIEQLERENRMLRKSVDQLSKRLEELGQPVKFT